jgi:hypothetical protein
MIAAAAAEAAAAGKAVVLAGISPPDGPQLGRNDPEQPHFLEIMDAAGALEHVEAVAFHAFPGTRHWSEGWAGWDVELASFHAWARPRDLDVWVTETGSSRLMPASRVEELRAAVSAARRRGVERLYWYSVEDVTWLAQREINLDWGRDVHDYATGLTPDVEAEIRRIVAVPGDAAAAAAV